MTLTWIVRIIVCLLYSRACLAELKLIQTVFRHGNRMPTNVSYYPKDPYVNYTYEPPGRGCLTNTGKIASYELGQYLRERYGEFLGSIYTKKDVWFRADEIDRVAMTGQLVAAALYPPVEEQRWSPNLNWQPIPIWAPPETKICNDYLYNGLSCENYKIWRDEVERTDKEIIKFEEENKDVYKYLSEHTGGNITQSKTLDLRQFLYAQKDIGLKLPEWTKSVFPNGKLDELAAYDVLIRTRTIPLKKLFGGVWIYEWLKHIDNYLNQNDTRKAYMYAAHELTIATILGALDNFNNKVPSYCSTIMFELHVKNNEYYVQVLYRDQDDVQVLKLPDCDKMCPLDVFKELVKPIVPKSPEAICGKEDKATSL